MRKDRLKEAVGTYSPETNNSWLSEEEITTITDT